MFLIFLMLSLHKDICQLPVSSIYKGTTFGVSIKVHIIQQGSAFVSVNGIGVSHSGTAYIDDDNRLLFDTDFDKYFLKKGVSISQLIGCDTNKIFVRAIVPLLGQITVNLVRENEFLS